MSNAGLRIGEREMADDLPSVLIMQRVYAIFGKSKRVLYGLLFYAAVGSAVILVSVDACSEAELCYGEWNLLISPLLPVGHQHPEVQHVPYRRGPAFRDRSAVSSDSIWDEVRQLVSRLR